VIEVNGALSGTWTANNVYKVNGFALISEGSVLTIEPGTTVTFDPGQTMVIAGELVAAGTEAEPILITSSNHIKARGDWNSLSVTTGTATFKYCTIEYGGGPVSDPRAIIHMYSQSKKVVIDHSTIRHSGYSGVRSEESAESLLITNSRFTNCQWNGVSTSARVSRIHDSEFSYNDFLVARILFPRTLFFPGTGFSIMAIPECKRMALRQLKTTSFIRIPAAPVTEFL
jgi:hypothetical protein